MDKYWCLTQIAKLSSDEALVYRDWTDEKVRMIINGEAHPIPKWTNKIYRKKKLMYPSVIVENVSISFQNQQEEEHVLFAEALIG